MATKAPRVVIVGGGFGGLNVAIGLRKADVQVTLIDRSNHHLFQPLLYQVATAGLAPSDIAVPIRSILSRQKNVEVLMAEVTAVDTVAQTVKTSNLEVKYDYLVLATGANQSYFGHPEWEKLAPGLKSVVDATHIRRKVLTAFELAEMESDPAKRRGLLTFILVGGGPTGVELAGSISELAQQALKRDFRKIDPQHTRIILIEAGKRVLASFSESLSLAAQKSLQRHGVEVMTGARVENIDRDGVTVGGKKIEAGTVIWSAGVAASAAGKWLGAAVDRAGRVKVEKDLSVPGMSHVYVIGDTAALSQDGKPLPGVAPVAMQQGKYLAHRIAAQAQGRGYGPFHYKDKGNLATVGRAFAVIEMGCLKLSGFFAWIIWLAVHIFYLIGFKNRIIVLLEWAWAYIFFRRGARLITNTPTAD